MKKELRSFSCDFKAVEDEKGAVITGRPIVYDSRTNIGEFDEIIEAGALDQADLKDVPLLINHDTTKPPLARSRRNNNNSTMQLSIDSKGLVIRATLDVEGSTAAADLYSAVKRGDMKGMSFMFTTTGDKWEGLNTEHPVRRIQRIDKVFEVSCVTWPAYEETSIEARSAELESSGALLDSKRAETEVSFTPSTLTLSKLIERQADLTAQIDKALMTGEARTVGKVGMPEAMRTKKMNELEIRSLQKFFTSGLDNMTAEERSAINISGSGAVLPVEIYNRIITNEKFADLLPRATVLNIAHAGTVKVPVATATDAVWKAEEASVTPSNPTLTSINLGGQELMRLVSYTAAVDSMTAEGFVDWLTGLVSQELTATLEHSFISGDASASTGATPHDGLDNISSSDMAGTVTATTAITAEDLAEGLSKLPAKYANNAIILMNTKTAFNVVGLFKGTDEYAYPLADGASKFMGKEIVMNEYVSDNTIYIVDPSQLYVRFAGQPEVMLDKSAGFANAVNMIRCLAVVDFAWNTKAVAKVSL